MKLLAIKCFKMPLFCGFCPILTDYEYCPIIDVNDEPRNVGHYTYYINEDGETRGRHPLCPLVEVEVDSED